MVLIITTSLTIIGLARAICGHTKSGLAIGVTSAMVSILLDEMSRQIALGITEKLITAENVVILIGMILVAISANLKPQE